MQHLKLIYSTIYIFLTCQIIHVASHALACFSNLLPTISEAWPSLSKPAAFHDEIFIYSRVFRLDKYPYHMHWGILSIIFEDFSRTPKCIYKGSMRSHECWIYQTFRSILCASISSEGPIKNRLGNQDRFSKTTDQRDERFLDLEPVINNQLQNLSKLRSENKILLSRV